MRYTEGLNRCTINELVSICKQMHLPHSGRKAILIERIQEGIVTQNVDVSTLFFHCRPHVLPYLLNEDPSLPKEIKKTTTSLASTPTPLPSAVRLDKDLLFELRSNNIQGDAMWLHAARLCLCGQQLALHVPPKLPASTFLACQECKHYFHRVCYGWKNSSEEFFCCWCRMRTVDPFYLVENIFHCCKLDAPWYTFRIDGRTSRQWRAQNKEIFATCHRVDQPHIFHEWPQTLTISINENKEADIPAPSWEHKRRDSPFRMTTFLKIGFNSVDITWKNYDSPGVFVLFVYLCNPVSIDMLMKQVPKNETLSLECAKNRVMKIVNNPPTEEDVECLEVSRRIKLTCPVIFTRMEIPCRGRKCTHLQCYDLSGFLQITKNMKAYKMRWKCPVCSFYVRPKDLIIDKYILYLLQKTEEMVTTVEIQQDGEFRIVSDQELLEEAQRAERERQLAEQFKKGEQHLKREQSTESTIRHAIEIFDLDASDTEEKTTPSPPTVTTAAVEEEEEAIAETCVSPLTTTSLFFQTCENLPLTIMKKRRITDTAESLDFLDDSLEEASLDVISLSDSEDEEHKIPGVSDTDVNALINFTALHSDKNFPKSRRTSFSCSPILTQSPPLLSPASYLLSTDSSMNESVPTASELSNQISSCARYSSSTSSTSTESLTSSLFIHTSNFNKSPEREQSFLASFIEKAGAFDHSQPNASSSPSQKSPTSQFLSLSSHSESSLSQSPRQNELLPLSTNDTPLLSSLPAAPSIPSHYSISAQQPLSQSFCPSFAGSSSQSLHTPLSSHLSLNGTSNEKNRKVERSTLNSTDAPTSRTFTAPVEQVEFSSLFSDLHNPRIIEHSPLSISLRPSHQRGPWRYRLQSHNRENNINDGTSFLPLVSSLSSGNIFSTTNSCDSSGLVLSSCDIDKNFSYDYQGKTVFDNCEFSENVEGGNVFSLDLVKNVCNDTTSRACLTVPPLKQPSDNPNNGHEIGIFYPAYSAGAAMHQLAALPVIISSSYGQRFGDNYQRNWEELDATPLVNASIDTSQMRNLPLPMGERERLSIPISYPSSFSSTANSFSTRSSTATFSSPSYMLNPLLSFSSVGRPHYRGSSFAFAPQTQSANENVMAKIRGESGWRPFHYGIWPPSTRADDDTGEIYFGKNRFSS